MTDAPQSQKLLDRVAQRLRIVSMGRAFLISFWGVAVLFGVAFTCSRLLGLIPDVFHLSTLALIPVAALLLAFIFHRRPTTVDAARCVDSQEETRDLYLTLSMLDRTYGEYQPLVRDDAEKTAAGINPVRVVPWQWNDRVVFPIATILGLLLLLAFVPQLDPFGQVEAAQEKERIQKELQESREKTAVRKAQLAKKQEEDGELSEDVEQALEELMKSFSDMEREAKEKNSRQLGAHQKEIGTKWRGVRNSDEMKQLLNHSASAQNFGRQLQNMRKWSQELEKGEPESLNREMEEIKEAIKRLQKATDSSLRGAMQDFRKALEELQDAVDSESPEELRKAEERVKDALDKMQEAAKGAFKPEMEDIEKAVQQLEKARKKSDSKAVEKASRELQEAFERLQNAVKESQDAAKKQRSMQQLKKKMKELEDFAKQKLNSESLTAAVQRAMKQMESSNMSTDSKEAMQAALESMELAQMELKEIAQSAKDLKALEEALKAIQMAKSLNQQGELQGEPGDQPSIEDYAEMYAEMMAELNGGNGEGEGEGGEGDGDGTGGEGIGEGGVVDENENAKTGFKKEKSIAQVRAGKILLSLKAKGISETGETTEQYKQAIQDVKQGVSEAIESEQIPPGYIPGIKKYFNTIEEAEPANAER